MAANPATEGVRADAAGRVRIALIVIGGTAMLWMVGAGQTAEVRGASSDPPPAHREPAPVKPDPPATDDPFTPSRVTPSVQGDFDAAQKAAKDRATRRQSADARDARRQSRTAYRGLGRQAALDLARSRHAEIVAAPPWRPVHLRKGERTVSQLASHAAVMETAGGERGLLIASHPLVSTEGGNGSGPVDHTLVDRGDAYAPANPLVPLEVGRSLDAGVRLPDIGLTMRAEAQTTASAPILEAGKAFWANVDRDTDFLVVPVGGGFETVHMLRSAASPEDLSLDFVLPDGAMIVASGDALGGFDVMQGDRRVALISGPRASDADGEPVAVTAAVAGNRLTMTIRHRAGDFAYPIQLDPYVLEEQRFWICRDGNGTIYAEPCPYAQPDLNGWNFSNQAGGSRFLGFKGYAYLGRGLYTWHDTPLYYNATEKAEWFFQAPGDSYIFRAEFGYVSHEPEGTTLYQGAWAGRKADWDHGTWSSPDNTSGSSPAFMNQSLHYNYKTHCFAATPCAEPYQDSRDLGNAAVWDMMICCYNGNRNRFLGYMGSSAVFLTDFENPYFTAEEPPPTTWVGSSSNPRMWFTARDLGLGAKRLNIYSPNKADWSGRYDNVSGCTGDRNSRCTGVGTTTYVNDLPDGIDTIRTEGWDILGRYRSQDWPVKVDKSAPNVTSITGRLKDLENKGLYESSYALRVVSADGVQGGPASSQRSGVARTELLLDGVEIAEVANTSCAGDNCPQTADFTFRPDNHPKPGTSSADGPRTIGVRVVDRIGNVTPVTSWTVIVDRQGSIVRAALVTGDPAAGGAQQAVEWTDVPRQLARREDTVGWSTRGRVSCPSAISSGLVCAEVRSQRRVSATVLGARDTFTLYRGTSPTDVRLPKVTDLLEIATASLGTVSGIGPIGNALAAWQNPPPAFGPNYYLYRTTETGTSETGVNITSTTDLYVNTGTWLPIKATVITTGEPTVTTYYQYDIERRLDAELPSTFFVLTKPVASSLEHDKTAVLYGAAAVGSQVDTATSLSFVPYYLGQAPLVADQSNCLASSSVITGAEQQQSALRLNTFEPGENADPTVTSYRLVEATYNSLPTGSICTPGIGSQARPALSTASTHYTSPMAAGWRGQYKAIAEAVQADPADPDRDRAGTVPVVVGLTPTTAYVIALPDGRSGFYVEAGAAAVVVNGNFTKNQVIFIAQALEAQ